MILSAFIKFIVPILKQEFTRRLALLIMEEAAKSTKNKLDDKVVGLVRGSWDIDRRG